MAEEYCGGANWWDSSPNTNRSSASSATALANSSGGGGGTTGYGWLNETSTTTDIKLDASSLQLMGLGLSNNSPSLEWNQHMIRNPEKVENNFRSNIVQEGGVGLNSNFQQETGGGVIFSNSQPQWRSEKLFPNNEEASEFKQIGGRGFSLDQPQFSPSCSSIESSITCNNQGFQLDSSLSSSVFGSPSSILQGLIGHPDQQHVASYGGANSNNTDNFQQHNYFGMPQFLKTTSPKQQQQQQQQLQFMNNAPYWNPSGPGASMNDIRPNFFSSLQAPPQLSLPTFEEKPKTTMELRDTNSMAKKSSSTTNQETNNTKRPRNDGASSTLPPFKTDTASVLSEAIEYIKFLHEQVNVLSNPYLKSGAPYQQQSGNEKGKIDQDGPKQDLRSRGLCLVPVSSTFPVAHETTVDFWTPTFGGTFR